MRKIVNILFLIIASGFLRLIANEFFGGAYGNWVKMAAVVFVMAAGIAYVLRRTANVIEETTEVLSERTKLAGGLLQSVGTAFPDMVLGITAAFVSLKLRSTDYGMAINYAIIAAATTFGSNIYNIGYGVWCVYKQNRANATNKIVLILPFFKKMGSAKPMSHHSSKPSINEIDTAIDVSVILTVLTAIVALGMVFFGRIKNPAIDIGADLYQLIRPVGFIIALLSLYALYYFRKAKKEVGAVEEMAREEKYYRHSPSYIIWLSLLFSGIAILITAESMVQAIEIFSQITGTPFIIAGALAGVIGCLGEMMVVHNYTVNPRGKIGDAIVGVAMDNIVTIFGASLVAIMGGIFLGGNALISIFVIILTLNSVLIWQISKLKNYFLINPSSI